MDSRQEFERKLVEGEPQEREPRGILNEGVPAEGLRGRIRVGFHGGVVILDLGGEVGAIGLRPDQAKALGKSLLQHANPVTRP